MHRCNMQESRHMMSNPQAIPLEVPARRKRNPRGSLNKEVILAEAFKLCREENLDELSMPKLAKRLGVGVTSLYWYFHTKDELLQTMLAQVADEFLQGLPDHAGLPWDEHFRRYFTDMRRIFLANDVISDFLVMYTHVSMIAPGGYIENTQAANATDLMSLAGRVMGGGGSSAPKPAPKAQELGDGP